LITSHRIAFGDEADIEHDIDIEIESGNEFDPRAERSETGGSAPRFGALA
jgi:hypothetical protein